MNLLDTIRANRAGQTDESAKVQKLLAAKSGKLTGPGLTQSSLGEQSANDAGNAGLMSLGTAANTQNNAIAEQERALQQKEQNQSAEIAQYNRHDDLKTALKTTSLLNELEQNVGRIDANRDSARMEQVAQGLRMQNKQYVDTLQREGKKERLDDKLMFEEQLKRDILGDNEELLRDILGNRNILDIDAREFQTLLAQMSVDQAWRAHQNEIDDAKRRQLGEAIGTATSMGGGMMGGGSGVQTGAQSGGTGATGSNTGNIA
jgi:hypothetical protein